MKKYSEDKKKFCFICGNYFRNTYAYREHMKIHSKSSIEKMRREKIRMHKLGKLNPAKRLDVRVKISKKGKGRIPWNKGKSWIKDKRHNKIVDEKMERLKKDGYRVFTTGGYVPDAIIIDFENKLVKAFELNPGSLMRVGLRAKDKGYDSLFVKIDRNGRYARKNMEREIPPEEF